MLGSSSRPRSQEIERQLSLLRRQKVTVRSAKGKLHNPSVSLRPWWPKEKRHGSFTVRSRRTGATRVECGKQHSTRHDFSYLECQPTVGAAVRWAVTARRGLPFVVKLPLNGGQHRPWPIALRSAPTHLADSVNSAVEQLRPQNLAVFPEFKAVVSELGHFRTDPNQDAGICLNNDASTQALYGIM